MIRISWLKFCSFLIFLSISTSGYSQDLKSLQQKYEGAREVVLREEEEVFVRMNKKTPQVTSTFTSETMITSGINSSNDTEVIFYSDLVDLISYEGFTLNTEKGKKVKSEILKTFKTKYNSSSVFDSDTKLLNLQYGYLKEGSIRYLKYNLSYRDFNLLHRFNVATFQQVEQKKLTITADKGIEIGYLISNAAGFDIQFTKSEIKGKTIYQWVYNAPKALINEGNMLPRAHILPHINYYIKSYTLKDATIPVLGTVSDLFAYYKKFTKDLNLQDDPELKKFTLSLVAPYTEPMDKLKAIFNYVQDHIKYVAFESGYEGFIPRQAGLVFQRKFADCKDMSSLITAMAKIAGVPNVHLAWIGTTDLPYTYEELPTPGVDNHMIAVCTNPNQTLFLDATNSYTKFGAPSDFIQGKEALVDLGTSYQLIKVPKNTHIDNLNQERSFLKIQDNKLIGNCELELHNLSRVEVVGYLFNTKQDKKNQVVRNILEKGNDTFLCNNIRLENLEEKELPFVIKADFTIDNHITALESQLYINLLLNRYIEDIIIPKDRTYAYALDFPVRYSNTITLDIPSTHKLDFIPDSESLTSDLLAYDIKYQVVNNQVIMNFVLDVRVDKILPNQFEEWNTNIKKLRNKYLENISLTKK